MVMSLFPKAAAGTESPFKSAEDESPGTSRSTEKKEDRIISAAPRQPIRINQRKVFTLLAPCSPPPHIFSSRSNSPLNTGTPPQEASSQVTCTCSVDNSHFCSR